MAATALAIVNGTGFLGITANSKLSAALFDRSHGMTFAQNAAEMRQIGVEIMQAHVASVDRSGGLVTSAAEAQSHFDIFAAHGLPATTFGGAPLTGTQTEASMTSGIWMGGC